MIAHGFILFLYIFFILVVIHFGLCINIEYQGNLEEGEKFYEKTNKFINNEFAYDVEYNSSLCS